MCLYSLFNRNVGVVPLVSITKLLGELVIEYVKLGLSASVQPKLVMTSTPVSINVKQHM